MLVAGMVPRGTGEGEYDPQKWIGREEQGRASPFIAYALCASTQALQDAQWFPNSYEDQVRTVCIIFCLFFFASHTQSAIF